MIELLPIRPVVNRETAFAFVLGVLFNQQTRADRAWRAPYELGRRLGKLLPEYLVALGERGFQEQFAAAPAIHPFVERMAAHAFKTATVVIDRYDGDARGIWTPPVPANQFISRFAALPGVGQHKARVALFVATMQLSIAVRPDKGNFSILSCGSLARLFHPYHEPIFTED